MLRTACGSEQFAQFKAWHDDRNHQQIGDPAKPDSVMIQFAEMEQPLVRFAADLHAEGKVLEKAESIRSEAEKWFSLDRRRTRIRKVRRTCQHYLQL